MSQLDLALEQACEVAAELNQDWLERRGDPGATGGFHVHFAGFDHVENQPMFIAELFGGGRFVGTRDLLRIEVGDWLARKRG